MLRRKGDKNTWSSYSRVLAVVVVVVVVAVGPTIIQTQ